MYSWFQPHSQPKLRIIDFPNLKNITSPITHLAALTPSEHYRMHPHVNIPPWKQFNFSLFVGANVIGMLWIPIWFYIWFPSVPRQSWLFDARFDPLLYATFRLLFRIDNLSIHHGRGLDHLLGVEFISMVSFDGTFPPFIDRCFFLGFLSTVLRRKRTTHPSACFPRIWRQPDRETFQRWEFWRFIWWSRHHRERSNGWKLNDRRNFSWSSMTFISIFEA